MSQDNGVPRVIVFRVDHTGGHIRAQVFAGQESAPGLAGVLTFRPDEWREFERLLQRGIHSACACDPSTRIDYKVDTEAWLQMLELQRRAAS